MKRNLTVKVVVFISCCLMLMVLAAPIIEEALQERSDSNSNATDNLADSTFQLPRSSDEILLFVINNEGKLYPEKEILVKYYNQTNPDKSLTEYKLITSKNGTIIVPNPAALVDQSDSAKVSIEIAPVDQTQGLQALVAFDEKSLNEYVSTLPEDQQVSVGSNFSVGPVFKENKDKEIIKQHSLYIAPLSNEVNGLNIYVKSNNTEPDAKSLQIPNNKEPNDTVMVLGLPGTNPNGGAEGECTDICPCPGNPYLCCGERVTEYYPNNPIMPCLTSCGFTSCLVCGNCPPGGGTNGGGSTGGTTGGATGNDLPICTCSDCCNPDHPPCQGNICETAQCYCGGNTTGGSVGGTTGGFLDGMVGGAVGGATVGSATGSTNGGSTGGSTGESTTGGSSTGGNTGASGGSSTGGSVGESSTGGSIGGNTANSGGSVGGSLGGSDGGIVGGAVGGSNGSNTGGSVGGSNCSTGGNISGIPRHCETAIPSEEPTSTSSPTSSGTLTPTTSSSPSPTIKNPPSPPLDDCPSGMIIDDLGKCVCPDGYDLSPTGECIYINGSPSPSESASPSTSPTESPSGSPTASSSSSPSTSPSPSPSPSESASPSTSPTESPSGSPTASSSSSPSTSPSPSPSPCPGDLVKDTNGNCVCNPPKSKKVGESTCVCPDGYFDDDNGGCEYCPSPKVIKTDEYGYQVCECPDGQVEENGNCVYACNPPRQIVNGVCQCPYSGWTYDQYTNTCNCLLPNVIYPNQTCAPCQQPKVPLNGICVCPPPLISSGSTCAPCPAPKVYKDGICVECEAPTVYQNGTCAPCPAPKVYKNGACVDCVAPEVYQNGVCAPCPAPKVYKDGACVACDPPKEYKDGACVDPPKKCDIASTNPNQCDNGTVCCEASKYGESPTCVTPKECCKRSDNNLNKLCAKSTSLYCCNMSGDSPGNSDKDFDCVSKGYGAIPNDPGNGETPNNGNEYPQCLGRCNKEKQNTYNEEGEVCCNTSCSNDGDNYKWIKHTKEDLANAGVPESCDENNGNVAPHCIWKPTECSYEYLNQTNAAGEYCCRTSCSPAIDDDKYAFIKPAGAPGLNCSEPNGNEIGKCLPLPTEPCNSKTPNKQNKQGSNGYFCCAKSCNPLDLGWVTKGEGDYCPPGSPENQNGNGNEINACVEPCENNSDSNSNKPAPPSGGGGNNQVCDGTKGSCDTCGKEECPDCNKPNMIQDKYTGECKCDKNLENDCLSKGLWNEQECKCDVVNTHPEFNGYGAFSYSAYKRNVYSPGLFESESGSSSSGSGGRTAFNTEMFNKFATARAQLSDGSGGDDQPKYEPGYIFKSCGLSYSLKDTKPFACEPIVPNICSDGRISSISGDCSIACPDPFGISDDPKREFCKCVDKSCCQAPFKWDNILNICTCQPLVTKSLGRPTCPAQTDDKGRSLDPGKLDVQACWCKIDGTEWEQPECKNGVLDAKSCLCVEEQSISGIPNSENIMKDYNINSCKYECFGNDAWTAKSCEMLGGTFDVNTCDCNGVPDDNSGENPPPPAPPSPPSNPGNGGKPGSSPSASVSPSPSSSSGFAPKPSSSESPALKPSPSPSPSESPKKPNLSPSASPSLSPSISPSPKESASASPPQLPPSQPLPSQPAPPPLPSPPRNSGLKLTASAVNGKTVTQGKYIIGKAANLEAIASQEFLNLVSKNKIAVDAKFNGLSCKLPTFNFDFVTRRKLVQKVLLKTSVPVFNKKANKKIMLNLDAKYNGTSQANINVEIIPAPPGKGKKDLPYSQEALTSKELSALCGAIGKFRK